MSTQAPEFRPSDVPREARVGIIAARFNANFVDELLSGCIQRLKQMDIGEDRIDVHRVPGAFELPVAAKAMADSKKYAAVICLGCVVRGDTPHFDYVAGEAARGIQQVAVTSGVPIIFGVLTTNTAEQAKQRIDHNSPHGHAGARAAEAAAEMIAVLAAIRSKRN